MIRRRAVSAIRCGVIPVVLALACVVPGWFAVNAGAADPFTPGKIVVWPQDPKKPEYPVTRDTTGTPVPVVDILREAADAGTFDFKTFPKITVGGQTLTRKRVMNAGAGLNVTFEADRTTIRVPGSDPSVYGAGDGQFPFTPKIVVFPKAADFEVDLAPKARTVKTGTKVAFTATVRGTSGKLTYRWSFGDGSAELETVRPSASHVFRGSDRTFPVTVIVTEEGNLRDGNASATVTIGKPEKKPDRKPDHKPGGGNGNGNGPAAPSGGSPGDYGGGGYGGYGSGTGGGGGYSGAPPITPAPVVPKPKEPKPQPIDDGLVPVRGELLDPSIPSEVIDPSAQQPGESAGPAQPVAEPQGFALSGGAKTAIGIAVLLGLGGLTEFRSFVRFR